MDKKTEENTIFVGDKPLMNYITGIVMQSTNANEIVIKARGRHIAKAVDITEIATKRFLTGKIKVDKVAIDSEELTNKEGKQARVSSIEITLVSQ